MLFRSAMRQFITEISRIEESKDKLKKEREILLSKLKELDTDIEACNTLIEQKSAKKERFEEHIDNDMKQATKIKEQLTEGIEKLIESQQSKAKAIEELGRLSKKEENNPVDKLANDHMISFLQKSIRQKEEELLCPVCLEVATVPIFACQEMHLLCSTCRPRLKECPECRATLQNPAKRHRFLERTAEEVEKLKEELKQLQISSS